MKFRLGLAAATAAIFACMPVASFAQQQVGQATLIRTSVKGDTGELAVKSPVFQNERIGTSPSGLGEFRFEDGTKFAVGGGSSVVVDRFIYDSSKTFDKLTLNAARGSFRWISGKSKSEAYEIVTPAGTIGIRGTRLDIWVGPNGLTSVVLLSGRAQFCGSDGCRDLRRRCDVVVATPGGGVSDPTRVNPSIFQTVGTDEAFPFLSGKQKLSTGFNSVFGGSCGLSASSIGPQKERGGATEGRAPSRSPSRDDGGSGSGGSGSGGCGDCNP